MKSKSLETVIRQDGWVNTLLGQGTADRDASYHTSIKFHKLPHETLEAVYDATQTAKIIVDAVIDDSLAAGLEFSEDAITGLVDETNVLDAAREAWHFSRLYGGAAVLPVFRGGGDFAEPVTPGARGGDLIRFIPMSSAELTPLGGTRVGDPTDPNYGRYTSWLYAPREGYQVQGLADIHVSRLIWFPGAKASQHFRAHNHGYDMSVLQRVYAKVRDLDEAAWSLLKQFGRATEGVMKIKGLMGLIAAEGSDLLQKRMAVSDLLRGSHRTIYIDADGEEYEKLSADFANQDKIFDKFAEALASAAEMPFTRLFGRSPAGMNATGESDLRTWEAHVTRERARAFLPGFRAMVALLAPNVDFEVTFPAIRITTELERAEIYAKRAEADQKYVDSMVFPPDAVAKARAEDAGLEVDDAELEDFAIAREAERQAAAAPQTPDTPPAGQDR